MWDLKQSRRGKNPKFRQQRRKSRHKAAHFGAGSAYGSTRRRHSRNRTSKARGTGGVGQIALAAVRRGALGIRRIPQKVVYSVIVAWIALGLGIAGFAMWRAPLKQVDVRGNRVLSGKFIADLAGLTPETAMGDIDPYLIARRTVAHPLVKSVDVRRVFPDLVRITVTERVPVVRVVFNDGSEGLLDSEGVVLDLPQGNASFKLPLIHGAGSRPPAGSVLQKEGLAAALEIFNALSDRQLGSVSDFQADISDPFRILVTIPGRRHVLVLPTGSATFALENYMAVSNIDGIPLEQAHRVDLRLAAGSGYGRVILSK